MLMWSLYTGQMPYVYCDGDGVTLKPNMLFPHFPKTAHSHFACLAERCLQRDPHERPSFAEITAILEAFFDSEADASEAAAGPPTAHRGEVASTIIPVPSSSVLDIKGDGEAGMSYCGGRSRLASCLLESQ